MRQLTGIPVLAILIVCSGLGAANMPTVIATNKSDSMIQVTPIDETHKAPAPLDQIGDALPPGAYILTNRTGTPINAVVTLWSYIDKEGGRQPRQMFCDGYMIAPSGNIVRANDSVLITPGGCTMREYFAHLADGKPMFGAAFLASTNKSITDSAGALSKVEITIDSVIFADGRIWGPDTRRYYRTVAIRHSAMQSVVEEVEAARAGGQDMSAALAKILAETEGKGDQPSFFRHQYAGNISRSPNPEGRVKVYSEQPPLPEFRHVGGENQ